MNIDNIKDFLKKEPIFCKEDGFDFKILSCYVNENRKASLIIEKEDVFGEGTRYEMDSKIITFLDSGSHRCDLTDKRKQKALGKSYDGGYLNMTKVSVPKFDDNLYENIVESFFKEKAILSEILENIIVGSIKRSGFSKRMVMEMCSEGYTSFGVLLFSREVFSKRKQNIYNRCHDGKPDDIKGIFPIYLNQLENLMLQVSAINMINNGDTKITIEQLFESFAKCDESEV